jgi:NAD(P)-dependent dehydrogenase (short-subunit alcohol dehydrogenase family)
MPTILITGSNRGLGLEWAKHFAQMDWHVIATCRNPQQANDLKQLAYHFPKIVIHTLDVTHPEQIAVLAETLLGEPIDLLINNAGVYFEKWAQDSLKHMDYRHWEESFRTNCLGVVKVTEGFYKNVAISGKKLVVAISSHMGSITDITSAHDYAYRSSKAALNATMKGLSLELKQYGIGILLLHPGWVKTRMGGDNAPLTTTQSVTAMVKLVSHFTETMSGRFYRYDGTHIPW